MGQKKLHRFAEIKHFENVFEYPENVQGTWNAYFKNANPITLELACGKGEYTLGLARLYADRNFMGIDVKGNRIWKGAKTAIAENLHNAAFIRTQIDRIEEYFADGEASEIWITFPDPQLRISRIEKRLTHPKFLRKYRKFLQPGGIIHLKTDSPDLYVFTKTVIDLYGLILLEDNGDVYASPEISKELQIKTHYEGLDIAGSSKVHYLKFQLSGELPIEKDSQLKEIIREKAISEGR
jgi:tRNA (guanine-N7-)-methyltransferase